MLFHQGDAAQLPFEDERFDVVTFTMIMHMIPESQRQLCLREASRVLRHGGRLLLIDHAGHLGRRKHWSARVGPHGRFDLHSLREPLLAKGFAEIDGGPLDWLSLHFLRGRKR